MDIFATLQQLIPYDNPRIIELGSHDGSDTARMLEIWPSASILCLEPDHRPAARHTKRTIPATAAVSLLSGAISNTCGETIFYQCHGDVPEAVDHPEDLGRDWDKSGSILEPTGHLDYLSWCSFTAEFSVRTFTLDYLHAEFFQQGLLDLVWADVQGAEGLLVQGGREALLRTRYLYVEFCHTDTPQYAGQPLLPELLQMLSDWSILGQFGVNNLLLRRNQ